MNSDEPARTDSSGRSLYRAVVTFISHLSVGVASLLAGVVLGGWIAFETGHWEAFRAWIEGLGDVALTLVVGLCLAAAVVSLAAAYASGTRR